MKGREATLQFILCYLQQKVSYSKLESKLFLRRCILSLLYLVILDSYRNIQALCIRSEYRGLEEYFQDQRMTYIEGDVPQKIEGTVPRQSDQRSPYSASLAVVAGQKII